MKPLPNRTARLAAAVLGLSLIYVGLAGGAACNSPALDFHVATGPGTDYPCGTQGMQCTTNGVPNGYCCGETEACGAPDPHTKFPSYAEDPTCWPNECCDVGNDPVEGPLRGDAGPRPPHQRHPLHLQTRARPGGR